MARVFIHVLSLFTSFSSRSFIYNLINFLRRARISPLKSHFSLLFWNFPISLFPLSFFSEPDWQLQLEWSVELDFLKFSFFFIVFLFFFGRFQYIWFWPYWPLFLLQNTKLWPTFSSIMLCTGWITNNGGFLSRPHFSAVSWHVN